MNKIPITYLSIFLTIMSTIFFYTKYWQSELTLNHIYKKLEQKNQNWTTLINDCEKIYKSINPEIKTEQLNKTNLPSKYVQLFNDHEKLMTKSNSLLGHGSDYLDFGSIYRDAITKEIIYAMNDHNLIPCASYKIEVNSKPHSYNYNDEYHIPSTENINITYMKFFPNFNNWSVDSIICKRTIKLE